MMSDRIVRSCRDLGMVIDSIMLTMSDHVTAVYTASVAQLPTSTIPMVARYIVVRLSSRVG